MTESGNRSEAAKGKAAGKGKTAGGKTGKGRGANGRPKADTVRDHYITTRVTATEKLKFLDKARRSGLTPTDYARDRILRGIARRKKKAGNPAEEAWIDEVTPLVQAVREIWHEVHGMAVNLNQMARHCNRHQVPPGPGYVEAMAKLNHILDRLTRP